MGRVSVGVMDFLFTLDVFGFHFVMTTGVEVPGEEGEIGGGNLHPYPGAFINGNPRFFSSVVTVAS